MRIHVLVFNNRHPYIINKTLSLISISNNTMSLNNVSIFNFKNVGRRILIYVGLISWNKLDNIFFNISNYLGNDCIRTCYLHIQYIYNLFYIYC